MIIVLCDNCGARIQYTIFHAREGEYCSLLCVQKREGRGAALEAAQRGY